jgi:hypothetical protein
MGLPPAQGVSSASLSGPFSISGWQGQATVTVDVVDDRIDFSISGQITQAPSSGSFGLGPDATLVLEIAVPEVGGPLTPIFWNVTDVVWQSSVLAFGCAEALMSFDPSSTVAGGTIPGLRVADVCVSPPSDPKAGWLVVPGGDTIRVPEFNVGASAGSVGQQTGPFSGSFSVRFRTSAPTLGTGDVNGDSTVDVLDVTLIRRGLAGLPPWP